MDLSLAALRAANVARLPQFKNARGEPAHSEPDGSDWKLSAWSNAVLGELGEAANIIKKIERGDFTLEEARPLLAKEFADVLTYLDLLAFRAGIDLAQATIYKWNEVSARVGSELRIGYDTPSNVQTPSTCQAFAEIAGKAYRCVLPYGHTAEKHTYVVDGPHGIGE